jgi:hypothetical protein
MKRRDFIRNAALSAGAAWLGGRTLSEAIWALPSLPQKFNASDTVTLGNTGIKTSRLAMGTGTVGFGGRSNQTQLGLKGLSGLLLNGYDHGLRFSMLPMRTAVIPMWLRPSNTFLATKSSY